MDRGMKIRSSEPPVHACGFSTRRSERQTTHHIGVVDREKMVFSFTGTP